jgi:hypothetical protein
VFPFWNEKRADSTLEKRELAGLVIVVLPPRVIVVLPVIRVLVAVQVVSHTVIVPFLGKEEGK